MSWRRPRGVLATLAVLAATLAVLAAPASALTLVPPKPGVFLGVSDRGTTQEFSEFTELLGGKHPALLETFHPWGNSLNQALRQRLGCRRCSGPKGRRRANCRRRR